MKINLGYLLLLASFFTNCKQEVNSELKAKREREENEEYAVLKNQKIEEMQDIPAVISCLEKHIQINNIAQHRNLNNTQIKNKYNHMKLGNISNLSEDVLSKVLSYIESKEMCNIREVNKNFYLYTTWSRRPGQKGIKKKQPKALSCAREWKLNTKTIDFSKIQDLTPASIMRVPFCQLTREVKAIPQEFWPYLKYTNVYVFNLNGKQLSELEALALLDSLKDTQVGILDLSSTKLKLHVLVKITENLPPNIHILNLSFNQLGPTGAVKVIKNLPPTVHTIDLSFNQIGPAGAVEVIKNLPLTIHTLDLNFNQLGSQEEGEIAKNLQNKLLISLDLGGNEISDKGAIAFGESLQDASLKKVLLCHNYLAGNTKNLLKEHYPTIEWIFDLEKSLFPNLKLP